MIDQSIELVVLDMAGTTVRDGAGFDFGPVRARRSVALNIGVLSAWPRPDAGSAASHLPGSVADLTGLLQRR